MRQPAQAFMPLRKTAAKPNSNVLSRPAAQRLAARATTPAGSSLAAARQAVARPETANPHNSLRVDGFYAQLKGLQRELTAPKLRDLFEFMRARLDDSDRAALRAGAARQYVERSVPDRDIRKIIFDALADKQYNSEQALGPVFERLRAEEQAREQEATRRAAARVEADRQGEPAYQKEQMQSRLAAALAGTGISADHPEIRSELEEVLRMIDIEPFRSVDDAWNNGLSDVIRNVKAGQ